MKGKGLAAAVMIACLLTGCVRYDGNRIGNESQLSMEYRVFNGSDQQELSLEARDIPFGFEGNEEKASFPFIDKRRDGR